MADLFGSPEGLNGIPMGLWPSPFDQTLECGHSVELGDLMGRISGDFGCEDCVTEMWEASHGDGHGGPF